MADEDSQHEEESMDGIALYKYQETAVNKALKIFMKNTDRVRLLLVSPTGAGKSIMACAIAKAISKKPLFIAHRAELLAQIAYYANVLGIDAEFSTIQSAHKCTKEYDFIIVDEAHHAVCKSYKNLLKRYSNAKVLGLTATPQRFDGKPLIDIFDAVIETDGISDLQRDGFLVPAKEYALNKDIDLSDVKVTCGDYDYAELGIKIRQSILFSDVLREFEAHAKTKKCLVYCVDVAHCDDVCQKFIDAGYAAASLSGRTKKTIRMQTIKDFTDGDLQVLVNCMLFVEGLDVPNVECIIMMRPTLSLALYLQMAGRGLRRSNGKTNCLILDHANNHSRHGTVNENRKWVYKTRPRSVGSAGGKNMYPSIINEIIMLDNFQLVYVRRPSPIFRRIEAR